jgi:hypothetical protein
VPIAITPVQDEHPPPAAPHWETAGLAAILAAQGVVAPHTGRPYTAAMLLGIGGGIGGGYLVYDMCGRVFVVTGFRNNWQKYKGEFAEATCARLGVPVTPRETGSRKQADADLVAALGVGGPGWVTAAEAALPYRGLPREWEKSFSYGVVVVGLDGDDVLVRDRTAWTRRVPRAALAHARAVIPYNKNRMLAFGRPERVPDVAVAARAGIRQCVGEMLEPPIKNFGVSAWDKWAALLVNPKDDKGWPRRMATGAALAEALTSVYRAMLTESGPDGLRRSYAAFLDESAPLLQAPALAEVAARYRVLAAQWEEFAVALLPASLPALAAARARIDLRHHLLHGAAPSADALPEVLRSPAGFDGDALPPAARTRLLAELADRLRALHQGEEQAIRALAETTR